MRRKPFVRRLLIGVFVAATAAVAGAAVAGAIIPSLTPQPTLVVSTVPANGDLNPYGVAFVPVGFPGGGPLAPGDILVSNFNNVNNLQGTGSTIVSIDRNGQQTLFFQGKGRLGLTTALGVLSSGFVIVGSLPTTTPGATCTPRGPSGQETGVNQGELLILDRQGKVAGTIRSQQFLDGPWDLTVRDGATTAQVFVSNALSGTVTRLDLAVDAVHDRVGVVNTTQIASGYVHRCDPAALVVGPTGLALDAAQDVLYVASTGDNAIFAVQHASTAAGDSGTGSLFVQDAVHMHGPLGLARATNGDLITSQGDAVNPDPNQPSEIVEYDAAGNFVAQFSVDSAPGSAFGLALEQSTNGFVFAAVDDGTNNLDIWVVGTD